MAQDVLSTMALPLIFSLVAGAYVFTRFPERRPALLLNLILFELLGAFALRQEPSADLLGLLMLHALGVAVLLVKHIQTPPQELSAVQAKR